MISSNFAAAARRHSYSPKIEKSKISFISLPDGYISATEAAKLISAKVIPYKFKTEFKVRKNSLELAAGCFFVKVSWGKNLSVYQLNQPLLLHNNSLIIPKNSFLTMIEYLKTNGASSKEIDYERKSAIAQEPYGFLDEELSSVSDPDHKNKENIFEKNNSEKNLKIENRRSRKARNEKKSQLELDSKSLNELKKMVADLKNELYKELSNKKGSATNESKTNGKKYIKKDEHLMMEEKSEKIANQNVKLEETDSNNLANTNTNEVDSDLQTNEKSETENPKKIEKFKKSNLKFNIKNKSNPNEANSFQSDSSAINPANGYVIPKTLIRTNIERMKEEVGR